LHHQPDGHGNLFRSTSDRGSTAARKTLLFGATAQKNKPMLAEFLVPFIGFAVRTVVLLILLGVMVKLQRFNQKYEYRFLKLAGAAALASALDMVPYAGHFLAVPVLWVGVKKVTHADYFETLFTMGIAYTLLIAGNHLLLGPLLMNLHTSDQDFIGIITHPRWMKRAAPPAGLTTNLQILQTNPPVLQTNAPAPQPAGTNLPTAGTRSVSGTASATNLPAQTTNQTTQGATSNAAPAPPVPAKPAADLTKFISVRGVTRNGANSAVTIQSGAKVYTIFLEEATLMQTPAGPVSVRFAELGTNSVTLEINDEPAKFQIH
jgi:hypothetical protein